MTKLKSGDQPFIEALNTGSLVGDGGMGTQLYERGILFSVNYEELNLSRPEVVKKVHEDYLRAGADVIETNTFGANAIRLARHGFEDKVREINLAAVALARKAADGKAYVAGAIGPSGLIFEGVEGDASRVKAAFKAQAEVLAEAGVDAL
ncbi:MAG TPA: homocysteine S-methyltransferase family protein, partial [Polyangiaceae bacterium]|nr:homocysteine S-methyltransferase family protein [Polyangiaceae bacterium]